jgi:cobalt-zinc-cadmium efflux system protein
LRHGQAESLNLRGAFLEVLNDLLGSAAVLVAGAVIWFTGFQRADAIASAVVGVLILPRTWKLLREALDVLLEAAPKGVDLAEVRRHLLDDRGVVEVHDLHAWTITSGMPVLSAHIVVKDPSSSGQVLERLCDCLRGHFDIDHSTIQVEPAGHQHHEGSTHP